jgi:hypothetical protein
MEGVFASSRNVKRRREEDDPDDISNFNDNNNNNILLSLYDGYSTPDTLPHLDELYFFIPTASVEEEVYI